MSDPNPDKHTPQLAPELAKILYALAVLSATAPIWLFLTGMANDGDHGFALAWAAIVSLIPALVFSPFIAAAGYLLSWGANLQGTRAVAVLAFSGFAAVSGLGGWCWVAHSVLVPMLR